MGWLQHVAFLVARNIFILRRSGSAWCAIGSFGGGLLGGDEVDMAVEVEAHASLALVTQEPSGVRSHLTLSLSLSLSLFIFYRHIER